MAKAYWLKTDGSIKALVLAKHIKDVNDTPAAQYCGSEHTYLTAIGSGLWLYMHLDNDFKETFDKTKLPINLALQKWFRDSKYVGDMFMAKTPDQDSDDLDLKDWHPEDIVEDYETAQSHEDHILYFFKKEIEQ